MNTKKHIVIVITILLIGLMITAGSYAFWTWSSNTSKNVIFNTADDLKDYIIYNEGNSTFSGSFTTSNTYTEGMHSTISMYKTSEAANVNMVATIHMNINSIGTNIATNPALKWVVTSGTSNNPGDILAQGNFMGASNGNVLTLVPSINVTTTETFYTVWIWLDASEAPSNSLSGETLDTNVWTEINQLEGLEDRFEITRLSANYQRIEATVVNNKNTIVSYGVTNTNNEPSTWTSITPTNIYNLKYVANATDTYYVWFKDNSDRVTSKSIAVTYLDNTRPTCSWGNFSNNISAGQDTTSITLTCTDSETEITGNITASDIVMSDELVEITNITRQTITNGYTYTLTLTSLDINGNVTLTLPSDKVINDGGLGNASITTSTLSISYQYLITLIGHGVSNFSQTGWTDNGNGSISKSVGLGETIDLSVFESSLKAGYANGSWQATGNGSLDGSEFTVGKGIASLTLAATSLITPTCVMTDPGETDVIYGNNAIISVNNTVSYASGVTLHYQFGSSTTTDSALDNYSADSTTNSYTINYNAEYTYKYYGAKVYATDGTFTSQVCTTGSGNENRKGVRFVNAKLVLDYNGGTYNGLETATLYVRQGYTSTSYLYTNSTGTGTSYLSVPTREGYTINGWWTEPTGGIQVLKQYRSFTGTAVPGYTTTNSWDMIEDKTLYAHWNDDLSPIIKFVDDNPETYSTLEAERTGRIAIYDPSGIVGGTYTIRYGATSTAVDSPTANSVTINVTDGDTIAYSSPITWAGSTSLEMKTLESVSDKIGNTTNANHLSSATLLIDSNVPQISTEVMNYISQYSIGWTKSKTFKITKNIQFKIFSSIILTFI